MEVRPWFILFSHLLIFVCLVFQHSIVSDSFLSELPFVFYGYCFVTFFGLSCFADVLVEAATYRGYDMQDGSPECPICQNNAGKRKRHCPKCQKCCKRFYLHASFPNCCISHTSLMQFLGFIGLDIVSNSFALYAIFSRISFEDNETLSHYLLTHIFLFAMTPIVLYLFIQEFIYGIQLLQMIISNTVALTMKRFGPFEWCVLLPKKSNPFNKGIIKNISDIFNADPLNLTDYMKRPEYPAYEEAIKNYWETEDSPI